MLAWKGLAFSISFTIVNAAFVVGKGQLFYRVIGQGLKPPLMSMCARP